ncbi:universal stress protein [Neptunicella marina]|uniref:Universal stress protein n=1 Tax=Neptunicella marina TaxID=2125989 RepID=A0A8J6M2J6_9ALTE|nr:universal stress protein [Neptunicella marina]MBC3764451.1 universal stress protein [Neptunicella marina]
MNSYQKVLVAIDPYATYEPVLERALKLVETPEQLSLIYVAYPYRYYGPYGGDAFGAEMLTEWREQAREKLSDIAKQNHIPLTQVYTSEGEAADEIHLRAKEDQSDLIVIGTHGQKGLKLLLGSTANAVLHGVKCDVLAVKV